MIVPRMTVPRATARLAVLAALAGGGLAACTPPPPTAQGRADQAAVAACRGRADQVFAQQNRGAVFLRDGNDSLYSGSGLTQSGITTQGLATRFDWDTQVSNCIRQNAADGGGTSGAAASTPASSASGAAASGAAASSTAR